MVQEIKLSSLHGYNDIHLTEKAECRCPDIQLIAVDEVSQYFY
ncbi:MAG: hypothetical protein ACI89W_000704 [Gammaproteobacteria bacterium]|jgi:hypothetical protein